MGDWTYDFERDEVAAHPMTWRLYGEDKGQGTAPAGWFRKRHYPADQAAFDLALHSALQKWQLDGLCVPGHLTGRQRFTGGIQGCCQEDPMGDVKFVHGVSVDITARKQTEEALRASELELRKLANALPEIVFSTNADGEAKLLNDCY